MFTHVGPPIELPKLTSQTSASGVRHYTTPEGTFPSITTVLGHKEKPWLKEWTQMLGADKAKKEQQRCSARGDAVHELVEKYLDNRENFTRGYDPKYIKGFNQLKSYLNKIDNIRVQEAALYSEVLKIAGRVDCIAEYEGVLSIVDFKTSNNNKTETMVEDYYKQCTAYSLMWYELTGELIDNIVILMYVEKGLVPLVFKQKVEDWIGPLTKTVNEYHTQVGE